MASVAPVNSDDRFNQNCNAPTTQFPETHTQTCLESKSEFQKNINKLADILSKLNPWAEEFIPSSYRAKSSDLSSENDFPVANKNSANDKYPNDRRRKTNFKNGRRRMNGKAFRAQREDSIKRTVYVSDIDQHVTEERLAAVFSSCGQVVDCRICGDPHSVLRFAFVEFSDEYGARAALNLGGTMLGYYPVRVLPSKTAILPVNPTFLPRSEDEREMCARTVYCTNIDKKVSQADVKNFFESSCGEVSRLRLLGDNVHSTRIAFVEFVIVCTIPLICLTCCLKFDRSPSTNTTKATSVMWQSRRTPYLKCKIMHLMIFHEEFPAQKIIVQVDGLHGRHHTT